MKEIGITMGDPAGVGPEIVVATLAEIEPEERSKILVVGNINILERANKLLDSNLQFSDYSTNNQTGVSVFHVATPDEHLIKDGTVSSQAGEAAYQYVLSAVRLVQTRKIAGIVTAPLSKEAMHKAGRMYDGHTGLLADLTNAKEVFILLAGGKINTIHVSAHISLIEAARTLTRGKVLSAIQVADAHFKAFGLISPRIAVAGINPHCGEAGAFGREEIDHIIPAINGALSSGINVQGPIAGDTIFREALAGHFDVVVAQYHDQGHIPTKLVSFEESVNVTLGIPIVRTSVDHGTAFDIAWAGKARNKNLIAAIRYAKRLLSID